MTSQLQVSVQTGDETDIPDSGLPPVQRPCLPDKDALKPLPQPRHAVIDEDRFIDELYKMDPEVERILAEAGLEDYLQQCPPY